MKKILFVLFGVAVFLGACVPTYNVSKTVSLQQGCNTGEVTIPKDGETPVITVNYMALTIDADWASASSAEQRAAYDFAAAFGLNGSTPSLANQGGSMALEGLESFFSQMQKQQTVTSPARLPVTPAPTPVTPLQKPGAAPTDHSQPVPTAQVSPGQFTQKDILSLRVYENKSFEWLPHTGAYYGGPVRFTFDNNCGTFTVPDAKVTTGEDGNPRNHNQKFYFCGTDFTPKPGEKPKPEYNNGLASVFTAPGCVASTVTIEYNTAE